MAALSRMTPSGLHLRPSVASARVAALAASARPVMVPPLIRMRLRVWHLPLALQMLMVAAVLPALSARSAPMMAVARYRHWWSKPAQSAV